jgi:hypothetical protein
MATFVLHGKRLILAAKKHSVFHINEINKKEGGRGKTNHSHIIVIFEILPTNTTHVVNLNFVIPKTLLVIITKIALQAPVVVSDEMSIEIIPKHKIYSLTPVTDIMIRRSILVFDQLNI